MRNRLIPLTVALLAGCSGGSEAQDAARQATSASPVGATATFGGGCFWCVEEAFDAVDGVLATTSGYMGGRIENPTYEQVSSGRTGHIEVVQVRYDPAVLSYAELLETFWANVDPLTADQQFCDRGEQYKSIIFADGAEQMAVAERSREAVDRRFDEPVVTEIAPAQEFYSAEEYHQDYYQKNPLRYKFYKYTCGREQRLREVWGEG